MTWLKEKYENQMTLTDASTVEEILQKARVYILLLFGGILFPDTNGNTIHLQYLPLLSDFNKTGQYSWGSATLAHLYRHLCRCAKKEVHNFAGCGVLLQAWGWSRMPRLAPVNRNPYIFPYATKWSTHGMNYEKTPHHCVPGYRTFIDHFEPIDFTWRPYLELEDLEPTDSDVWSSKTFIISFTYVEMHHSDRVKLQFGIKQGIPGPPTCMEEYHKSQLSDQWPYDDWKDHYKNERRQWHNRHKTDWNNEGTRLSYGSATAADFINEEMVEELYDRGYEIGPSTQPANDEDPRRRSMRDGHPPNCGTNERLRRLGRGGN
ncbi:protein MAIN-LIKE 2-like [Vicia villosa]|uniref:protein MAIN-LIKE 2-like n=1 Tax=Vicia villosa TaxID=3911 RepID=UPI00273A84A2|nr:protein MAIN-LIKE 2-like [Vicia villosa]